MSTVDPALERPEGFRPLLSSDTCQHQLRLSLVAGGFRLGCRCGNYVRFLPYGPEGSRAAAIYREEHMEPILRAAGIPWQRS